ncbi:type VI secretion system lipoprotein TssJ [uncultured Tateyamaria sp.]|uniref:type VI secretion system lipoprotein TssJ n=1 Tax=uncultured Tateyamaria sp. TaxID=455651 RepID=UPI00261A402B|nr:type VI secretion system lipoprotein TssJ [uncultured Tateyamaria sp.]
MTLTRRNAILSAGGFAFLSACLANDPVPGSIMATANMTDGANPGPDGSGRPLTVTLVQLRSANQFSSVDFATLQDPESALAADLVRTDKLVLAPGGTAEGTFPVEVQQGASTLGIVAGFRQPAGKVFRLTQGLPATGDILLNISVTASGLSVS